MRRELVVMGWLLVLGVAFAQADSVAQADRANRLAANLAYASSTLTVGLEVGDDEATDTPPLFPAPDPFADLGMPADGAPMPPPQQPVAEPAPVEWKQAGPPSFAASTILSSAQAMLGIPYVWGGNTSAGMDCSAWVSKTWGLSRQTTDTLYLYSKAISKDELLPGDAMNLTTRQDPRGYGHIRLFAAWANEERSRVWVFEETPRQAIYHVIAYDERYQPIRRTNFTTTDTSAPLIPAPTATPRPKQAATATPTRTTRENAARTNSSTNRGSDEVASLLTKTTPTASAAAAQDLRSTTVVVTVVPRYIPTPEPVRRTPTPLPWREPTPFPTPRLTSTPTQTPTPTATPRSTSTPTPTATARPTVTATATPTATATAAPTASATPSPTSTPTSTPTAIPTATSTPSAQRRRFGR